MISLPPAVRIFLARDPADMRRGFDGLAALTASALGQDPLSGHLFVFRNRRGDRLKVLYWDRDGLAIWMKRLERGSFRFPPPRDGRVEVTPAELAAILEGIDLERAPRRPRFAPPPAPPPARGDKIA
jgi:transposase